MAPTAPIRSWISSATTPFTSKDGSDNLLLGFGNDRVTDTGGSNIINDLGGDNTITLTETASFALPEAGTDRVTTGDGNDNINALGGTNFIDAGEGDNRVRGGDGYDEFKVGAGADFVEVGGGVLDEEDANGNGLLDLAEDKNFNGTQDPGDKETFVFLSISFGGGALGIEANNAVFDSGGSDNLRASGNDRSNDLFLSDLVVDESTNDAFPGIRFVDIDPSAILGDDVIDAGAGDNVIIDAGGNDTVEALDGDDIIFTSFFSAGNDSINSGAGDDFVDAGEGDDEIDSGAGDDTILPGSGADTVDAGAGGDIINLSDTNNPAAGDGAIDTLVYAGLAGAILSASDGDLVEFFEFGPGGDIVDVSGLDRDGDEIGDITGTGVGGLNFVPGDFDGEGDGTDLLLGWDFDLVNGFELGVDPIIAILEEWNGAVLSADNFTFA